MKYPFLLYCQNVEFRPVFPGLAGEPYVADLSRTSPLLDKVGGRNPQRFQAVLEQQMGPDRIWGVASYLERRDTLLGDCPQMAAEKRFFHLGLDVIVPLATPLHAPLDAVVAQSGYESGEGNYGGFVLLRHELDGVEPFFSFYGHLCRTRLPCEGTRVSAGQRFAEIGDFHENGNWFHHTHLQVITEKGLAAGYVSKGYCREGDLADMNDLCPSPIPLFKRL